MQMNKEHIILNIKEIYEKMESMDELLFSSEEEATSLDLDLQLMYIRLMYDSYLSLKKYVKPAAKVAAKEKNRKDTGEEIAQEEDDNAATLPLLFAEEPEKKSDKPKAGKESSEAKSESDVGNKSESRPDSSEKDTKEVPVAEKTVAAASVAATAAKTASEPEKPAAETAKEPKTPKTVPDKTIDSKPEEPAPKAEETFATKAEEPVSETAKNAAETEEAAAKPKEPAIEMPKEPKTPKTASDKTMESESEKPVPKAEETAPKAAEEEPAIDLSEYESGDEFDMDSIEFELDDEDDSLDTHQKASSNQDDYPNYYPGLNPRAMKGELDDVSAYSNPNATSLGEHFANQFPSLNDQLSQKRGNKALGERMQMEQISDLTKSIDLNLKFLFIKELFKGDATLLTSELQNLNRCQHLEKALAYFEDMKLKYHWKEDNEAVDKLYELILRKYAK